MKPCYLLFPLLAVVVGCHSPAADATPAPVDALLGHWQADTERLVRYTTTGGPISYDTTIVHRQEFDFAATTYTKVDYDYDRSGMPLAAPTREKGNYGRTGEEIGFSLGPGNYDPILTRRYVRDLTPTRFTLETVYGFSFSPKPAGGNSFIDFHR
ncbi:hypothetical protein CDA63_05765 [Hymenobacter amundsenii]|uniref:Lipocalin-like domain-containing protein n=1 Tax=Hymenobacter amundsenii TaxID=2006685 RepID=A0A246FMM3_9BACT|nr:hypothetical protein [Hymenobacter amundsenii]OWP63972.1 hypothetical protein CDA63_05765 [Hymenobacter amundsenii]